MRRPSRRINNIFEWSAFPPQLGAPARRFSERVQSHLCSPRSSLHLHLCRTDMGEEEAELVEGEGEGEPIDPRMAAVLEAAESGDLETLCSLFDQVEVSRCTLSSRSTVITPCFTKCDLA